MSDDSFSYGDWVQSKLNSDVFGIVVGSDLHGIVYQVQLCPDHRIIPLHRAVLTQMDDSDEVPDDGAREPLPIAGAQVIDFKAASGGLRKMKTAGSA